jgi:hypothetical protein
VLVLLALACVSHTADVISDPPCDDGFTRAEDGNCYPAEGDPDTDADGDTDSDTDTDTDTTGTVDADGDGYTADADCDDGDASRHPDAVEICDGIDDDCDGSTDDEPLATFYRDADGDGFGDPSDTMTGCQAAAGYVSNDSDCDDAEPSAYPGAIDDTNDGIDNDCDGSVDEDWDACAAGIGSLELDPAETQYVTQAETFIMHVAGYGYVCAITCADWWLSVDGISNDRGASYEPLPYLVDGDAPLYVSAMDPNADSLSTCTLTTSAGDLTITVQFYEP